jgi:hypothetical protein
MTSEAYNELGGQSGQSFDSMSLEQLETLNGVSQFAKGSAAARALARKRSHAENEQRYFLHGTVNPRSLEQQRLASENAADAADAAIRARAVRTGRSAIERDALLRARADRRR